MLELIIDKFNPQKQSFIGTSFLDLSTSLYGDIAFDPVLQEDVFSGGFLDMSQALFGDIDLTNETSPDRIDYMQGSLDLSRGLFGNIGLSPANEIPSLDSGTPLNLSDAFSGEIDLREFDDRETPVLANQVMSISDNKPQIFATPAKPRRSDSSSGIAIQPPKVNLLAIAEEQVQAFSSVEQRVNTIGMLAQTMVDHMKSCTGVDGHRVATINKVQIEEASQQALAYVMNNKLGAKLFHDEQLTQEEEQQVARIISHTFDAELGVNTSQVIDRMEEYHVSFGDMQQLQLALPALIPNCGSGCGHEHGSNSFGGVTGTGQFSSQTTMFGGVPTFSSSESDDHKHCECKPHEQKIVQEVNGEKFCQCGGVVHQH